ncbi:hypothetical protein [Modestobacter sp. URMC 112]
MDRAIVDSLHDASRRARQADSRRPPAARDVGTADPGGPGAVRLLALQRSAGNAAVNALLAAKVRPDGGARAADLDAALAEARKDTPDLPRLEKGLEAAKAVGVPVDIDGAAQKPPASALAVTRTGFGPAAVPDKRPVPPPKPLPAKSPLAKGARRPPAPAAGRGAAGPRPPAPAAAAGPASAPAGPVDRSAPPVPPAHTAPAADPAFIAVTGAAARSAAVARAHPPAAAKAREAQDAAVAPSDDVDSQAKAAKVDTMDAQPAGSFDKKAFIVAVKAAIEAKSPKSLEEAAEYKKSGKAAEVKNDVKGMVGGNKAQAAEKIETATSAAPDTSKAEPKPVGALSQEDPGRPAAIPAGGAVPKPAPPEQLNLAAGKQQVDQELAGADVTEDQLARSNEPEFTGALAAKQEAAQHADTAPGQFRQEEAAVLGQTRAEATATTAAAVGGMHGSRTAALSQVMASKAETKGKDEARRAEVSAKVQSIFAATEADVKKTLDGIDPKVDKAFEDGEKGARAAFEAFVEAKMSAYKKDRYGGWLGGYRWLKDKVADMPSEVNEFYVAGRELYLKEMDGVISTVADIVGTELATAKNRIAAGKAEIAAYVKTLPGDLQKVGAEAATAVGDQFERLDSDVASKQEALVDSLASKYVESRKGLDDRIEQLQEENKGLVGKAVGAIKAAVQTVLKLKDMLLGVLARAAGAVGKIIKDPIGFLGNFVNAVKGGIQAFASNIWEHLKKGLQAWLFGALAAGGIELPDTFDLKGVLKLVGSIFGLTWANVRSRIVAKIGAGVMGKIESGLEVVKLFMTEGLGGLWKVVLEKVGDLKEMVLTQIQDMVVTQIVKAGITWLISMLNPAGAFIKACKMIYDVVMFFVEKADQIKEFVDAVLDSVESIAGGGVGAVASKIEQTMAKMLPVIIGFLASLLGLGGISEKIKKIIETVQKPVNKAIDWVIGKAVHYGKRFLGSLKAKAKGAAKKLTSKVKKTLGIKEKTPEQIEADKRKRLEAGLTTASKVIDRLPGRAVPQSLIRPLMTAVRLRYRMSSLEVVAEGRVWKVLGKVNPKGSKDTGKAALDLAAPPASELTALGLDVKAIERIFAKTRVEQAKGQILEELALAHAVTETAAENASAGSVADIGKPKTPGDSPLPQVLAAHRVKASGADLGDGVKAILGTDKIGPFIRVLEILESKSGGAKRELSRVREPWDKASAADKKEARSEAIDDLVAKEHPSVDPSDATNAQYLQARRAVLANHSEEDLEYRAKRKFEGSEHLGQPGQDLERLSPDLGRDGVEVPAQLLVDGIDRRLEGFSRAGIRVRGVTGGGVARGRTEKDVREKQGVNFVLEQLKIPDKRLQELAQKVVAITAGTK